MGCVSLKKEEHIEVKKETVQLNKVLTEDVIQVKKIDADFSYEDQEENMLEEDKCPEGKLLSASDNMLLLGRSIQKEL